MTVSLRSWRAAVMAAVVLLALIDGGASISAQQQSIDPALLNAYRWRSIGPDRGGRSIAVSGVKGRPREAYFGATGGGLWKTTDAGNNWTPVTDGLSLSFLGGSSRELAVGGGWLHPLGAGNGLAFLADFSDLNVVLGGVSATSRSFILSIGYLW